MVHPAGAGGRTLVLKRAFVEDVRRAQLHDRIRSLRRPLLVMHSPTDNTVGIGNTDQIFREARHPQSFVALEEATTCCPHAVRPSAPLAFSAPGPTSTSTRNEADVRCVGTGRQPIDSGTRFC
ncbi:hypothetical protein [Streptomyces fractus]|uniref:hypothetical protein n=1 Tax=Streptomyces fractus TaxID=641806 RepID=UPI003CE73D15